MIEALIFDVDGTLAETEELHRRAFNAAFEEFGLDWVWDEALYRDLLRVTGGKERILHFIATTGALEHIPQKWRPILRKGYAIETQENSVDPEGRSLAFLLHRKKTAIYTDMVRQGAAPLRPGVEKFLEAAAQNNIDLAIATTTSLPNVESLLAAALGAHWRRLFPVVAAGDMVERKKPAPDIYRLALDLLDRKAEKCLAVEDSQNGVQAALAAGLRVIAVRSAFASADDLRGAIRQLPDCTSLSLQLLQEIAA